MVEALNWVPFQISTIRFDDQFDKVLELHVCFEQTIDQVVYFVVVTFRLLDQLLGVTLVYRLFGFILKTCYLGLDRFSLNQNNYLTKSVFLNLTGIYSFTW